MDRANWTKALVRAFHPEFLPAWEAAEAKGRAEGIEAAAKVADEHGDRRVTVLDLASSDEWDDGVAMARDLAASIRALSQGSGIEDDTPAPAEVEDMVGMREALEQCEGVFLHYAALHLEKGTADGEAKAQRNADLAAMCRAALSRNQGGGR